jgi:hypothetical protein
VGRALIGKQTINPMVLAVMAALALVGFIVLTVMMMP